MFLSWRRRLRRRRIKSTPFPQTWLEILDSNVLSYGRLSEFERKKLRDDLRVLVAEKNWEGCDGLALTKAFTNIKDSKLRRRVVDLVEEIAGDQR